MAASTSYLVTGASRGIGLEFVIQILEGSADSVVLAAARQPKGTKLEELGDKFPGRLHIIQLDVCEDASLKAAIANATELLPAGLDYLIANVGTVGTFDRAREVPKDNLVAVMNTNFISAVFLIQLCVPLLQKGNKKRFPPMLIPLWAWIFF
eukprot:jgi/Botrbrau1/3364/Bobra.0337s0005.1